MIVFLDVFRNHTQIKLRFEALRPTVFTNFSIYIYASRISSRFESDYTYIYLGINTPTRPHF